MAEVKVSQLTHAQLQFMLSHHAEIENAYDLLRRGQRETGLASLRVLENSEHYQQVFGDLVWDEAIERYEDSPDYDPSLRRELIQRFHEDAAAGKISHPTKSQNAPQKTIGISELRRTLLDECPSLHCSGP